MRGMRRSWTPYIGGILVGMLAFLAIKARLFSLLCDRATFRTQIDWTKIASTPRANAGHRPQGITAVDGDLAMTTHFEGKRSMLYRLDADTGEIKNSALMPPVATHTSGLSWDGELLWAVDHACNNLYKLDFEATLNTGKSVIKDRTTTGLSGCSGLTLLENEGNRYAAISDFLWTIETTPPLPMGSARTYIVPVDRLWTEQSVPTAAVLSYENGGYSQGLTWDGEYLYESLNNIGTNRVEILDIMGLSEPTIKNNVQRVASFQAPGYFVEDLATDRESLWTSDERQYELYELPYLKQIRQRLS